MVAHFARHFSVGAGNVAVGSRQGHASQLQSVARARVWGRMAHDVIAVGLRLACGGRSDSIPGHWRRRSVSCSFLGMLARPLGRLGFKPEADFLDWHGREVFRGAARHLEQ
jgi:hypothetical protein